MLGVCLEKTTNKGEGNDGGINVVVTLLVPYPFGRNYSLSAIEVKKKDGEKDEETIECNG